MKDTTQAILLVADISGYTQFLKMHAVSTNHAKQIVVRLLKALIRASKPPLKVAELEGDAVFFYALSSANDIKATTERVKAQILKFFSAFNAEMSALMQTKLCVCDACTKVGELKLKQVVHLGEVAIERIERFEKLFGLDVVVVHRMLKNSVPSHEYVMMTDPVYSNFVDFFGLEPERRTEQFEGVGEVDTLVFYASRLRQTQPYVNAEAASPSLLSKLGWITKLVSQTLLDLVGLRKIKGAFNNLPA